MATAAAALVATARLLLDGAIDLLYPPRCLVCGDFGPLYLCAACVSEFETAPGPACRRCGAEAERLPGAVERRTNLCRRCAGGQAFAFIAARGAFAYSGLVQTAIHRLKYDRRRRLAEPLAMAMLPALARAPFADRSFVLVPVPLHPSKLRQRGFNQAELLASTLAEQTGLPLILDAVRRVRATEPQARLKGRHRFANVEDAFEGVPGALAGLEVLLIDDVVTTLATANACSVALLRAGAQSIHVLALARGGGALPGDAAARPQE
ncbi:MAG: ComF family protein [Armatimonadetes bacterium]|nr:ComF family protein [Armatimonadota bacterium]